MTNEQLIILFEAIRQNASEASHYLVKTLEERGADTHGLTRAIFHTELELSRMIETLKPISKPCKCGTQIPLRKKSCLKCAKDKS